MSFISFMSYLDIHADGHFSIRETHVCDDGQVRPQKPQPMVWALDKGQCDLGAAQSEKAPILLTSNFFVALCPSRYIMLVPFGAADGTRFRSKCCPDSTDYVTWLSMTPRAYVHSANGPNFKWLVSVETLTRGI